MSSQQSFPRPVLHIPSVKHELLGSLTTGTTFGSGALSPNIQPNYPPGFLANSATTSLVERIGKYLLFGETEQIGQCRQCKATHIERQKEFACKIFPKANYREALAPYWAVGSHSNIAGIEEILLDSTNAYVIFQCQYEDLHSYIRKKRRLRESEAHRLFSQIVSVVNLCHENGVIICDLKLRKFGFKDAERTHLFLNSLEEAHVLSDPDDDQITNKNGCPAYVSPEILYSSHTGSYSGKAADIWSLGVVLYTMLIGQYPFHDTDVGILVQKIRQGYYSIPDFISPRAKCLIKNFLRTKPADRPSVAEVSVHPWLTSSHNKIMASTRHGVTVTEQDQRVPEIRIDVDDGSLLGDLFHNSSNDIKY